MKKRKDPKKSGSKKAVQKVKAAAGAGAKGISIQLARKYYRGRRG